MVCLRSSVFGSSMAAGLVTAIGIAHPGALGQEQTPGLDQRPVNSSCVAPPRPNGVHPVTVQRAFPALAFELPVALRQAPGDPSRWFVVERAGRIMSFANFDLVQSASVFIDISERVADDYPESGMLGLAFHPDFASNGQVFLSYTGPGTPLVSVLSRFVSHDGGLTLDPTSETVIATVPQPTAVHQGGGIGFGPDGYLYIGLGDGGPGGDPHGNAQDTSTPLGAILRIDVDGAFPYAIPVDNPFAHGGGRPEIYAWGFRNPWGWSFDRETGDLWVGDVGQNNREEVNRVENGGNYGWNVLEGSQCYSAASCDATGMLGPVAEYSHLEGCSITGGHVYRGAAMPLLGGTYIYGDFCSGRIWGLDYYSAENPAARALLDSTRTIVAFGEDADGELYLLDYTDGGVYRLEPAASGTVPGSRAFPVELADSGCVDPLDPSQPAPGLIPYETNVSFWSDGADKERWLALPEGATIDIGTDGNWTLPVGSVVVKNFSLEQTLVETRLLVRHDDGLWAGYSYRWNAAGTGATYVAGGRVEHIQGVDWIYPSEAQCMRCHTQASGYTLGLETRQLNRSAHYPSTGRSADQLLTLDAIGVFSTPLGVPSGTLPRLPDPDDSAVPLATRARAYAHVNCAYCHQPGGPTPVAMDLRYDTPHRDTRVCGVQSNWVPDYRLIEPGHPDLSVLPALMDRRDRFGMPPLASSQVDENAVAMVRQLIAAIAACP